jgi:hypothetical protein
MAVNTASYVPQLSQDQTRVPSQGMWFDCPDMDLLEAGDGSGGSQGLIGWDDFNDFPDSAVTVLGQTSYNAQSQMAGWDTWIGNNSGAAVGTLADTTNLPLEGGVIGLYGGTTAIDITMCKGTQGMRLISPATGFPMQGKTWFECRIAVSTITSANLDLFVGLMDHGYGGTNITSAASLCFSATNTLKTASGNGGCIGFWKRATTNPTDVAFAYNVNNGTVQTPGSSTTLQQMLTNSLFAPFVTGTGGSGGLTALASTNGAPNTNAFVKLGFKFDPTPSCLQGLATSAVTTNQTVGTVYSQRVQIFVNGQRLGWFLTTTDVQAATFPSSYLVPTIGYRSGGTAAGKAYIDWVKYAQIGTY